MELLIFGSSPGPAMDFGYTLYTLTWKMAGTDPALGCELRP